MKIEHPLKDGLWPIQNVLWDLSSQENCDGEPYDQMYVAGDYIRELESLVRTLGDEMGNNVLEIRAVDMAKATGFFHFEKGPINNRWTLNLPTEACELVNNCDTMEKIFDKVLAIGPTFDYITVFDDKFSELSLVHIWDYLQQFPISEECRLNIPLHLVWGKL